MCNAILDKIDEAEKWVRVCEDVKSGDQNGVALLNACRWLFLDFCPFRFAIILQVIWPSRYNLCSSQLYGPVVAISSFRFPPKIIGRTAESPLQHIQPAGCADFLEEGA